MLQASCELGELPQAISCSSISFQAITGEEGRDVFQTPAVRSELASLGAKMAGEAPALVRLGYMEQGLLAKGAACCTTYCTPLRS